MDDSLSFESFLAGAKKAAHRAMDGHGRGEYDEFACSLELNTQQEIFASGVRVSALTVPNQAGNITLGETYAG
ncbi:hypothetical protein [Streptomyces sp. CC224B]|uniref:hypothetical protein n=1 Tax=Streptomyces sp. CC224B TaxID=3044571 RepID=UPI0024A83701|nr:hypothetical protein [Streptomyces sp. CC224B]